MKIEILPANRLGGSISVPGDKSISHRGIIFGSLARGATRLRNFLLADDCKNTIDIFRKMGVEIEIHPDNTVLIRGKGFRGLSAPRGLLNADNSGTTARLLLGLLSGQNFDSIITGDDSLQSRPMNRIIVPLRQMGATLVETKQTGFLPIEIRNNPSGLKPIDYTLPVASAQVKSSIILASLYADGSSIIHEPVPTRDHTEKMLKTFGGKIHIENGTITTFPLRELQDRDLMIPGDISSAAYFITAGLLVPESEIVLSNVGINPTRTGLLDVYKAMGAKIDVKEKYIGGGEPYADIYVRGSFLNSIVIQGSVIPRLIDELPIIALAATQAKGTTIIKDAGELRVKESNRIDSTVNILKKFGANIESTPDGMVIQGPTPLSGADVRPGSDHRAVMMTAIAALISQKPTVIHDHKWVNISYPDFFTQIEKLRC